jgi:hypothetical protein
VADDKSVEIDLTDTTKAISVDMDHRLFSGKIKVSSRNGRAVVRFGSRPKPLDDAVGMTPGPREVAFTDAKPGQAGHELKFEAHDPNRHEVASVTLFDGQKRTPLSDATLSLERKLFPKGGELTPLSIDIDLRVPSFTLPDKFRLQPYVQIGSRELLLNSCKVEFERFLQGSRFTHSASGYTEVTLDQDKRAPKTGAYDVKIHRDSTVCRGLEVVGQRYQAAKFSGLEPNGTLKVHLQRDGGRAFVGIVKLSREIRSKQKNWTAVLKALQNAFDAGADPSKVEPNKKHRYLWGAIYGPDGKTLIQSETADYAPQAALDIDSVLSSPTAMERLKGDTGLTPFDTLVEDLVGDAKELKSLDGNVDVLIVSDTVTNRCGWSGPGDRYVQDGQGGRTKVPRYGPGSRIALVRIVGISGNQGTKLIEGVRRCEKMTERGQKAGVVAELEVAPEDSDTATGATPDMQLTKAISEAASSFFTK